MKIIFKLASRKVFNTNSNCPISVFHLRLIHFSVRFFLFYFYLTFVCTQSFFSSEITRIFIKSCIYHTVYLRNNNTFSHLVIGRSKNDIKSQNTVAGYTVFTCLYLWCTAEFSYKWNLEIRIYNLLKKPMQLMPYIYLVQKWNKCDICTRSDDECPLKSQPALLHPVHVGSIGNNGIKMHIVLRSTTWV